MIEKRKSFRGGYYFGRFYGKPDTKIEEFPLPPRVVIPLKQGYGEEVPPTVSIGDTVKAGMIIGECDQSISTPVHASVSGKIKDIHRINYLGKNVGAIEIESDGTSEHIRLDGATPDFKNKTPEDIARLLYKAGVTSQGSSGIPTHFSTSDIAPEKVEFVVVSALSTDPLAFPASSLIQERIGDFVSGLSVFHHIFGGKPVHVGISSKETSLVKQINEIAREEKWLHIHPVKPKYPQEIDEILVESLTHVIVPDGKPAISVGALVMDIHAVLSAYEAVVHGKPLIESTVILGGGGYKDRLAVRIRLGTLLSDIAESKSKGKDAKTRFIFGNVLTGMVQSELSIPIGRDIRAVAALEEYEKREFLFFMRPGFNRDSYSRTFVSSFLPFIKKRLETNLHGELRPCIQCSYCANVCPRPLLPHLLAKFCSKGWAEEVLGYRLMGCIECGLCSYVCPSKIPLMTQIQKGKEQARKEGLIN